MRLVDHKSREKALFLWFKCARSSNIPVTWPILEEKARDVALRMGIEDFNFSDGWLSHLKYHGLVYCTIAAKEQKLQDVLSNYGPSNIFKADETTLFCKLLPNKTLKARSICLALCEPVPGSSEKSAATAELIQRQFSECRPIVQSFIELMDSDSEDEVFDDVVAIVVLKLTRLQCNRIPETAKKS
ncbi:hypothetical protein HPB52_000799 [Rhipicephalus sanguineus]|uniref:HTH CENPB-type domain-containing protein n=1 Tax=Rhipicephalus sanguineus TaxID=34632 RepID=A0A9D4PTJ1_RHISA|nr:hypothetical protein HPB52_000799 [Rhipicephalus sanguineus]